MNSYSDQIDHPESARTADCTSKRARSVAERLNDTGLWTELDSPFVGKHDLDNLDTITHILSSAGYKGGPLSIGLSRYASEGTLYVLFDASRIPADQALRQAHDRLRIQWGIRSR